MTTKLRQILIFSLLVCGAPFFSSCYTPAGRSAGEVIDDAAITTEIKATLLADKVLSGIAISVTTFEGQVTLTGAAHTAEQKQKASHIAQSVKGVKKVDNHLKIK
jgi:osmotically-inducible protein OsmY